MSSTIFELLERIQKSPGMYLGYPSVQSLFMFLNGYDLAREEIGIALTPEEEVFYDKFQPWLQKKLGIRSVASWAKLIMLSCHDEKTGFERFFELLSEFRKKENISVQSRVHHIPVTIQAPPITGSSSNTADVGSSLSAG